MNHYDSPAKECGRLRAMVALHPSTHKAVVLLEMCNREGPIGYVYLNADQARLLVKEVGVFVDLIAQPAKGAGG